MTKREMTASEMGRKGGVARAKNLTPARRKEIARKAIKARWDKYRKAKANGDA